MRFPFILALWLLPGLALAQSDPPAFPSDPPASDPPVAADAFERLVEGKTMDTYDQTGRYGVETFLPDRRAIWRDVNQCLEGTWRPQGDLICFDYQGDPTPYCWAYHDRDGWLMGWLDGDRSTAPIYLHPSAEVVTCEGYFGA